MTATTGFKRLGFVLLAVLAATLGVVATATLLISADTVRREALQEIRTVTGLDPRLRGEATVSLFPTGSVSFADVVLGDARAPALAAERLTVRLRFFPLLIGRVEIADVSLERPRIAVDIEPNGQTNWSALVETLARSRIAGETRVAAFSEMRITDGVVTVHKAGKTIETQVEGEIREFVQAFAED